MGTYRGVVRHVRYWRGVVHRWSTSYQMVGSFSGVTGVAFAHALLTADDKMCYGGGLASFGGTYECSIYDEVAGGTPLVSYIAFDWTTPASWIAHSGTAWGATTGAAETNAEVALDVKWPSGISRTGKPVSMRKWYHAVPSVTPAGGAQQIPSATVTSLNAGALAVQSAIASGGVVMGTASGRIAGTGVALPFYGNHQMPKGRRRVTAASLKGIKLSELEGLLGGVAGLVLP